MSSNRGTPRRIGEVNGVRDCNSNSPEDEVGVAGLLGAAGGDEEAAISGGGEGTQLKGVAIELLQLWPQGPRGQELFRGRR